MSEHPFVVSFEDTLVFELSEDEGILTLMGHVECLEGAVLYVTKFFELRHDNHQRMSVRCYSYRYVGCLPGERWLLKYHNLHSDPDEYVHRVYNPENADDPFTETLERYQFPTFPQVLDEFQILVQDCPKV